MTNKPEVTDAMVDRALDKLLFHIHEHCSRGHMREVLTAALSPPAEPEVTREMSQAGLWAFYHEGELPNREEWRSQKRHDEMAAAYRAMHALERRKEAKCEHVWVPDCSYELGGRLDKFNRCTKCGFTTEKV